MMTELIHIQFALDEAPLTATKRAALDGHLQNVSRKFAAMERQVSELSTKAQEFDKLVKESADWKSKCTALEAELKERARMAEEVVSA
jgi:predicted  nucleic acid-binding Zn-ribbon protein